MSEADFLAEVRSRVLRGDTAGAERIALAALNEHPQSNELRRALAGIYRQTQRDAQAETLLREVLAQDAGDAAAAFTLAEILKDAAKPRQAASVRDAFEKKKSLAAVAPETLDGNKGGKTRAAKASVSR